MALNLDTAIRLSAQVKGLDQFKTLADRLLGIGQGSEAASGAVQQLSGESTRLGQEAVKAASGVKIQGAALQELQAKTRASGAEARKVRGEFGALGGAFQQLRGQSAGVLDGVVQSSGRAANGIREFQRELAPTDQQLAQVRAQMLQLAESSKTTERSLQQQTEALKRLKSQAEAGGQLYQQLTADIERLKNTSKGLEKFTEPGIRGWKMLAKASADAANEQHGQVAKLKGVLATAGEGYQKLGREIDALRQKAANLDLSKGLQITPGNVAKGVGGAIQNIVQLRRDLSRSMSGRVILTGEGLAAAGVTGAAGAGVASGLGGLAGGASAVAGNLDAIAAKAAALPGLLKPLGGLLADPVNAMASGIGQWSASLSAAQAKLAALSAPFEAIGTAISTIGPEASAAAGVASLAIAGVYQVLSKQADEAQADLERSFRGISDDAQKLLQDLARIYDRIPNARLEAQKQLRDRNLARLGEVPADSVEARRAASAVVAAEREIAKIQAEQNGLIETARQRQNAVAQALEQQLQAGRQKVNTARQELSLAERVAQVQRQAAERRRQSAAAEAAESLRRAAAAAFPGTSVLALPAAGQTSFQGSVNAQGIGGGARRLGNYETAGTSAAVGAVMGVGAAGSGAAQSATRARGQLAELFVTIDKVTASSNGSISSLQRQRGAWEALRNAVNPAAPAYAKATAQVEQLDKRLQQLTATQQKQQRQGIGREALGSALGTIATGGGLQGAVGALAGGLAFSGGARGLAAGAAVAGTAGVVGYGMQAGITSVESERRLRSLAGAFGEVEAAQAAAARAAEKFGISQSEANRSFAQIYARLRPVGISLQEIETAYNGFNTAAKLGGTTAVEASAAWMQLSQALGSGVLRGEELNSVFEQTPAVVQAIAKEMGIGVGQIREYAKEGKITSDIVLRALKRIEVEGAAGLANAMGGPTQAIKDFQIATERVSIALTKNAIPEIGRALKELATLIENLEGPIKFIGGLAGGTLGTINDLINAATKPQAFAAAQSIRAGRLPMAGLGGISGAEQLFLGTSGAGGVGLTGIKKEAEELAKLRRQPVTQVMLELMQSRLGRMDAQSKPGQTLPMPSPTPRPTAKPAGSGGGSGSGGGKEFQLSSRGRALVAAASKLGVSPLDLATIISFETGGSFNPSKWGGAGGNYMGLIQFGPTERKAYGARPNQSFEEQVMGPVVRYFQDRFKGVGMSTQGASLEDLYTTVLAGNPKANRNARDSFGTSPRSGVARMGPHRQKALSTFFGGSMANVGFGAFEQAQAMDQMFEDRQQSIKQGEQLAKQFSRQIVLLDAASDIDRQRLQIGYDHQDRQLQINELIDAEQKTNLTMLNDEQKRVELRQLDLQLLRDQLAAFEQISGLDFSKTQDLGKRALTGNAAAGFGMDLILGGESDQLSQYKSELDALQNPINMAKSGADAIGQAFGQAFASIATGSQSTQEILATMFQNIANSFIQMAAEIIAKQLAMIVFQQVLNAIGGGFAGPATGAAASGGYALPSGGGFAQGFSMAPIAFEGGGFTGYGTRTGGIDGRGGFPAILHPNETVIDHTRGAPAGAGSAPITVNVNVDASGTKASGDAGVANALGRDLAAVVDSRLVYHKRSGGLLAPR
jgi:tape measure domain-containing protein